MTLVLVKFNTSDGKQPAIADVHNGVAETLVVLSETDADGLTAGQISFKQGIGEGTTPGTYCH